LSETKEHIEGELHEQLGEYVLGEPIPIENPVQLQAIPSSNQKKLLNWDNNLWTECESSNEIPNYKKLEYTRPSMPNRFTSETKPHEIFSYFLDESFMQHLMTNTNSYAEMFINTTKGKDYLQHHPSSRVKSWKPLEDTTKIKLYIAALIFMGLVKEPGTKGTFYSSIDI